MLIFATMLLLLMHNILHVINFKKTLNFFSKQLKYKKSLNSFSSPLNLISGLFGFEKHSVMI